MPLMKRPAAVQAAGAPPAKKTATASGFSKKCEAVTQALMEVEDIPLGTRKMLCAGFAESIQAPKDQRHPFLVKLIGWVQDSLAASTEAMKKKVEEADAQMDAASSKKEECTSAQTTAKANLDSKVEAVATKKTAVSEAETAFQAAEKALKEAEKAQTAGDAELVEVAAKKSKLEDSMTNVYMKLKAGGLEPEEQTKLLEIASATAAELGVDQSMLTSLPSALGKAPDKRGQFDLMVVDSFEGDMKKRLETYTQTIEGGEPAKAERAAKVEEAKAHSESCTTLLATAKEELTAAKVSKEDADAAMKTATKAVKDAAHEVKNATSTAEHEKKALSHFEKGVLADFKELSEWDGKVKGSQYKTIAGVRYEKDLLEMAGDDEITVETAEKLFETAMDGNVVTPTEKRTLRYILKKKGFVGEAKNILETKIGSSWYQSIDGVSYERTLLTIAAGEATPFGMEAAEKLWASAQDRNLVTACEKRTLEYILGHYEFVDEAKEFLAAKVSEVTLEEE